MSKPQIAIPSPLSWSESTGDLVRLHKLQRVGLGVLRYGLVFLLVAIGLMKFTAAEAQGISPLVANSPLMSWMYSAFSMQTASDLIGVVEIVSGVLIASRRWLPGASGLGSALASVTFVITLSFLFSTPGALSPESPFNGFLLKDIILLGAALLTAAEALLARAAAPARR